MKPKLTDKQAAFVSAYLENGFNATQAALSAGYSPKSARSIGAENLTKPNIRVQIDEAMNAMAMPGNEVLARLAIHARADMTEFIGISSNGVAYIDLEQAKKASQLHMLKKFKVSARGIEIQLHDSQAALRTLAQHHGLLKTEVTINVNLDLVKNAVDALEAAGLDPAATFEKLIQQAQAHAHAKS